MQSSPRIVRFIVVSSRHQPHELSRLIGVTPDEERVWARREPHQYAWEIRREGTTSEDVSTMIEEIIERLIPAHQPLAELCADLDTDCKLRIVLYIEDDSLVKVGPGFAISSGHLAFLSSVGASIDADLYGMGEADDQ